MKKNLFVIAVAFMALCGIAVSCKKNAPQSQFVGVYDLHLVYDSVMLSDGTWCSEEFYEEMTMKRNPPRDGYLTITEGKGEYELNLVATIVDDSTGEEKELFNTTATEKADGTMVIDDCESDYYYSTIDDYIYFTFRGFENKMPVISFKGIYTINLGADFSYLTNITCTKRQ